MALPDDFVFEYDTEAAGPFQEGELLTFSGGITAELIILRDDGTTGRMYCSKISGSGLPADNETITGGTSSATAAVNGPNAETEPFASRFPLKIRDDLSYTSSNGNLRWTGGNLGATHSCKYDNEASGPFVVGDLLEFSGGATGELIELVDNGLTGELYFRLIGTTIPADNENITTPTGSGATADVDGVTHQRIYRPIHVHYWLLDLGDDSTSVGDDDHDRTKPNPSQRVFTTIVTARGSTNIDASLSYRMYGGSWSQNSGADEWGGVDIEIVDPAGLTEPVLIQNNALLSATTTEYWKNYYGPGEGSAKVQLMVQYRSASSDIDGRRLRTRALEFGDSFFTPPQSVLGVGITVVSLATSDDGNNNTAAATVATWTEATLTTGYQTIDHNNGNGAQPYWGVIDRDTRTAPETHERFKWVQRRGTSETIAGLNAQLIVGNDLDVPYDNEASGPFQEDEILTFGNGATAVVLALDDQGTTGTLYCQLLTGDTPPDDDTISGGTSSATADVNGTPTTRLITNNLVGVFTGAAFNPANRGITLEADDAITDDLFTDLLGGQQAPPDNQTATINTDANNVITVYPYDGSSTDSSGDPEPDFDFLTIATTALTGAAETSIEVNTTIPSWLPTTGKIRVTTDGGVRRLITYTSYTGSTFTIPSTDFSGDNASIANGVMPAPLDGLNDPTWTGVYSSDQVFVYAVYRGSTATPKQPAKGTVTFGSGGFNLNVTLQDDGA